MLHCAARWRLRGDVRFFCLVGLGLVAVFFAVVLFFVGGRSSAMAISKPAMSKVVTSELPP